MRLFFLLILATPLIVRAEAPPAPQFDVLSLDASATAEVNYDQVVATLAYEAQGEVPAELIDAASRAINAALTEAKEVKSVTARTGQFSSFPVYGKEQQVNGWRVRAELILGASDFKALAALAGKLAQQLAVSHVSYILSNAGRKAVEGRLMGEAIAAYREKAQAAAQAFGYAKYRIREITVTSGGAPPPRTLGVARMAAQSAWGATPLPIEAGQISVTVTVAGSVQLGQ